jgi:AraC-like DNA-binding protein
MYREHAPPPRLADLVECVWTMRSGKPVAGVHEARVLPDGCMDVIFELGNQPGGGAGPRSYAVGAMRTSVTVAQTGMIDVVAVRFRPGGASAFTGVPADRLTDRTVALDALWGGRAGEMEERLFDAAPDTRAALLFDALARLAPERRDARVAHASGRIERAGGAVAVEALVGEMGISRRQLERIFAEHVGLTPKMACRVARVRSAMDRIRRQPNVQATALALDCGWYDQPHMIRDFGAIAGTTPAAFARDVANLQDAPAAGD